MRPLQGKKGVTEDKFELHFGTNYLGHFLLTQLLLKDLRQSAPARIVNIVGNEHLAAKTLDFAAVKTEPLSNYSSRKGAYDRSKLALMAFSNYLANKLKGSEVSVFGVHPGNVATDLWKSLVGDNSVLLWAVKKFLISPEEGAIAALYPALAEDINDKSGAYFVNCKDGAVNPLSRDERFMKELWKKSKEWTFLK